MSPGWGASDRGVGPFIKRFAGLFSTDEAGLAAALYDEVGIDLDRVNRVFPALDESYTSDADDVAVLYLKPVFAGRGRVLEALRRNVACRATLIRVLDEGWTTSAESALVGPLLALH